MAAASSGTTYTLTPAANNVNEGSALTFTVGGTNITNGTYYWTVQTNSGDFSTTNGTVTVTSNSGTFSVTPTADATTEDPSVDTFTVALRSVSTSGTILVTSAAVTINDTSVTPTYSLAPGGANNVNEGSAQTFYVGGTDVPAGTYYWTIETNAGDFATTDGTVSVSAGTGFTLGSFTVTPTADATTEGTEQFTVALRTGSISGTIVASSGADINDTSLTAITYSWVELPSSLDEGQTSTINISTTGVADGTQLYWNAVFGSTISIGDFAGSQGSFFVNSNAGAFSIAIAPDTFTEGAETFTIQIRTGSNGGTVVSTSESITINDTSSGVVSPIAYLFNGSGSSTQLTNRVSTGVSYADFTSSNVISIYKATGPQPAVGWQFRASALDNWRNITDVQDGDDVWTLTVDVGGTATANNTGQLSDNKNAEWALGTTWTIEFWIKPDSIPGENDAPQRILSQNTPINIQANNGYNNLDVVLNNGSIAFANQYAGFEASALAVDVWSHVAISSSGGNVKGYIDGVEWYSYGGLGVNFTNGADDLYIGKNGTRTSPNVNSFSGRLTDIRISNTARYTAPFNPAIALSPTRDANTKLLLTPKQNSWYGSETVHDFGYSNQVTVDYPTPPIYTLDYVGPNNVNEGSDKTFEITGTNIPDGTYYWTLTNNGEFTTDSGEVTVTGNSGSFTVTPTADATSEGSETFTVQLRLQSITGVILVTSSAVTINDTSLTRLTSGTALVFNGTNNYHLVVEDNPTDWYLADNWTIEWWQKIPADAGNFLSVLCQDANVPPYGGIDVFVHNGSIQMFNGNLTVSEAAATRGQWNHIAIQKDGTTVSAYINGSSYPVSGSHPGTIAASAALNLVVGSRTSDGGATPGNFYGQYFNGRLANIRISTVARYSTTFTPPTTVASDANTVLALSGQSGGAGMSDDVSPSNHTITNNGAVSVTVMNSIGPMNAGLGGGDAGSVYFDRSVYPGVESVPVGATMSSSIFASPVTITSSQAWIGDTAYWEVVYIAPPGTPGTNISQTFNIIWTA